MKEVLSKLNKIQTELKAPKGQFNSFGKYKYRSCEDILESVKPLLASYGCALTISDTVIMHGDRFYVEATASLYDCVSGEMISNQASAREEFDKKGMDASQITGTASSYARKYALNGLLAIDDTKDADATNTHGKDDKQTDIPESEKVDVNRKINSTEAAAIKGLAERTNADVPKMLEVYKVKSLDDLTLGQWNEAQAFLNRKRK